MVCFFSRASFTCMILVRTLSLSSFFFTFPMCRDKSNIFTIMLLITVGNIYSFLGLVCIYCCVLTENIVKYGFVC